MAMRGDYDRDMTSDRITLGARLRVLRAWLRCQVVGGRHRDR